MYPLRRRYTCAIHVREGLKAICEKQGLASVAELTGGVKPW